MAKKNVAIAMLTGTRMPIRPIEKNQSSGLKVIGNDVINALTIPKTIIAKSPNFRTTIAVSNQRSTSSPRLSQLSPGLEDTTVE